MASTFPCPKCFRPLEPSGEVALPDGSVCPVYQCPNCTAIVDVGGEACRVPYTFAVFPDGTVSDPMAPEPRP